MDTLATEMQFIYYAKIHAKGRERRTFIEMLLQNMWLILKLFVWLKSFKSLSMELFPPPTSLFLTPFTFTHYIEILTIYFAVLTESTCDEEKQYYISKNKEEKERNYVLMSFDFRKKKNRVLK